jgi:hypothetical protein
MMVTSVFRIGISSCYFELRFYLCVPIIVLSCAFDLLQIKFFCVRVTYFGRASGCACHGVLLRGVAAARRAGLHVKDFTFAAVFLGRARELFDEMCVKVQEF